MRKTILCYGDSNTWGFAAELQPADKSYLARYPEEVRWTGVLQALLGEGCRVVEEGLNARVSVWDDVTWPDRNGLKYLRPCLNTHAPIDLVVLMLGTNDLKVRISGYVPDIARAAGTLVKAIQSGNDGPQGRAPEVLLVSPVLVGEGLAQAAPDIYEELPGGGGGVRLLFPGRGRVRAGGPRGCAPPRCGKPPEAWGGDRPKSEGHPE